MTSSDGFNWTDRSITDRSWETIRWSGDIGIFLAVAKDGYIATSSDGFVWTESELTGELRGCCWSSELGTFVVVGHSNVVYSTSLKERKPTSENVFNSEFNSIDDEGNRTLKSLTTTGNATIGGTLSVSGSLSNPNQPCFKVITSRTNTSVSCVAGENLKFNEAVINNRNAYNSTDFEYTIPVAGNWYFYYSFACDGEE